MISTTDSLSPLAAETGGLVSRIGENGRIFAARAHFECAAATGKQRGNADRRDVRHAP